MLIKINMKNNHIQKYLNLMKWIKDGSHKLLKILFLKIVSNKIW